MSTSFRWSSMRKWRSCSAPDVDAHDALVSNPLSSFHRHPHLLAHALCCMLQSQEHSPYALKSWGGHPRCDLAPLTTSFGTVALRERQHLAMAGLRHLHFPRNATAHCAARANYHVPHWCSVLAETDARTRRLQEVRQLVQLRSTSGCTWRGYEGCVGCTVPHCLCRPFHTRYFPVGHVAIYRCQAYKGNEWKITSSLDSYLANLDP